MKKKIQKIMTIALAFSFLFCAGCGQETDVEDANNQQTVTEAPEETESPEVTETPAATEEPEVTEAPVETEAPVAPEVPVTSDVPETPEEPEDPAVPETPEEPEVTKAPEVTEEPVVTEAPEVTEEPVVTETPAPTEAPKATEAPAKNAWLKTEGNVDKTLLAKVEVAFAAPVKEMKDAGLVGDNDVCVKVTENGISGRGHALTKDGEGYILEVQGNYLWLEDMCAEINGVNPAPYNKKMLMALLEVISDESAAVFARIDEDCFSANSLSGDEWETVGDCYMKSHSFNGMDASYNVVPMDAATDSSKYEKQYNRDASHVLKGTRSDGSPIEVVIEYDSSVVEYGEFWGVERFDGLVDNGFMPMPSCEWIRIGNDCASYEEYKAMVTKKLQDAGVANPSIEEYNGAKRVVDGRTFYECEIFYMSDELMGDPDMVYAQIGPMEYIEIHNIWMGSLFEEFVKSAFYIAEVR